MKKKDSENNHQYMPIGMCMGISIGTALGVAFDNISVWMCLGLSFGLCVGIVIDQLQNKNSETEDQDSQ